MSGILRVVAHDYPTKGQTLNLEVAAPNGKMVTIQLTGPEAKLLAKAEGEREFKWNGKPRPLRPVSVDDMIPIQPETHVLSFR